MENNTDVEIEREREKLRGRHEVQLLAQKFPFPPSFLVNIAPFFSFLFFSLFPSLRSRLSVAMATVPATAEEERIPEERKGKRQRSKRRDEDGWRHPC